MTKRLITAGMVFLFGVTLSLSAQWAKAFGGKRNDRAWSVIQDAAGNFVLAGTTESFGKGTKDMWIFKLSPEGNILWQRSYGDNRFPAAVLDDEAFSIGLTRDGRYIVTGTTGEFIDYLKYKSNGDVDWQKYVPQMGYHDPEVDYHSEESAQCIRQSADGCYVAVGSIRWSLYWRWNGISWVSDPGLYAVKTDGLGAIKFRKNYGGNGSAASVAPVPGGGDLIAGRTKSFGMGDSDFWLLKIDSTGELVWQYSYGGIKTDEAHDIALTTDGGCVLAGPTSSFGAGGVDAWVIKLDAAGRIQWQKAYGGPKDDYAHAIRATRDGGYIVAGSTSSFGAGDFDAWVFKLNKNGNIVWQKTYGGKKYDGVWAVQEIKPSGYIVVGKTSSFGAGKDDVLALRLDKNGDIDASCGSFSGLSRAATAKTKCSANPTTTILENYICDWGNDAIGLRLAAKGSPTVICKKAK